MPDKIKILYDAVSKDYSVGSFDEFSAKLQDEGKRKAFYDGVGAEYDLGDYETFSQKVLKKKASSEPLPIGSNPFSVNQKPAIPTVLTGEARKQAQEKFDKNKDKVAKSQPAPKPQAKVTGGAGTSFMKGLSNYNESLYNLPKYLFDLAAIPQNAIAEWTNNPSLKADYDTFVNATGSQSPLSILRNLARMEELKAGGYDKQTEKFDKGVFDNIKEGKYADAGQQVLNNFAESAPSMIGMILTGNASNAVKLGKVGSTIAQTLPFASAKNADLQDNPDIPAYIKPINATFNGLSEVIYDQEFGTSAIVKDVIKTFGNEGKEIAVKKAKDFVTGYITNAVKKFQPLTSGVKNAIEEMTTQYSQNLVDKLTVNPDKDLFEGVPDAAIVGGVTGTAVQSVGTIGGLLNSKKKQQLNETAIRRQEIITDLDNDNLPDEIKADLMDQLEKENDKIGKLSDEAETVLSNLPEKEQKEALQAQEKIEQLEQSLSVENVSEGTKQRIEAQIEKEQEKLDVLTETAKILNKPDTEAQITKEAQEAEKKFKDGGDQVEFEQTMSALDERAQKLPKPVEEVKAEPVSSDMPESGKELLKTEKLYATLGGKRFEINSFEEASAKQQEFFKNIENSRSDVPYVGIDITNEKGEVVANISQNGKIWEGKDTGKPGAKLLYNPNDNPSKPENIDVSHEEITVPPPETQAEVKAAVSDKAVELKSKPDATDKVLKAQKKDMLTQLNEVKDIVFGKREEADVTPETIAKVRELGYDINDAGQVTFDVKDDGTFKIHADNLADAISEVKKGFPETTDTENKVKMPGKGRVSERAKAESRGSLQANELNLNNAKENLQTAIKSGNKKLQAVFEKEVEREQKIYDEAKRIGLPEKSKETKAKSNQDQRPEPVGASVEGKGAEVKSKEPIFERPVNKKGEPSDFAPNERMIFGQGNDSDQAIVGLSPELRKEYSNNKAGKFADAVKKIARTAREQTESVVQRQKGFGLKDEGSKFIDLRHLTQQQIIDYAGTIDENQVKNNKFGGLRAKGEIATGSYGRDKKVFDGMVINQNSQGITIVTDDGVTKTSKNFVTYKPETVQSKPDSSVADSGNQSSQVQSRETLPIDAVNKIPKGNTHNDRLAPKYYEELKNDIKANGIKEPIILRYYPKDNALRVFEGHHRLKIANELGIKNIPVQINVVWGKSINDGNEDIKGQDKYSPPIKLSIDKYKERQYFPSSISVDEIGLRSLSNNFQSDRDRLLQEKGKLERLLGEVRNKREYDRIEQEVERVKSEIEALTESDKNVTKTKLQTAKEKLKEAKAKLDKVNTVLSIASDPKEKAKAFYDYHVALVEVAKEYISEGITTVQEFAKELGEKVSQGIQDAWDEANGGKKKSIEDFDEVSSPNEPTDAELQLLGITKKEARRIREEQGEEQYEYDVKSRAELIAQADRKLAEGYNVPRLIKRITDGGYAEDFEVEILRRYFASLTAAINKKPTPELLAERKSLLEALDHLKTRAGRAVQAFDGFIEVEDNLASFLQDEGKYYDLSPEEVQELTEKYNKAKEALEKLQKKQEEALSKALNTKAQQKINELKARRRASVREDFAQERKAIVEDFRAKLKQIRNTPNMVMLPYQNELIALAPFVKKLTESYVRQGVFELSEIVKGIHDEFKGDIPDLTEADVRDLIAGEYTNPRETKNAKLARLRDLETQARLERKIEELEAGIISTKSKSDARKKSDRILELERQIKEIKRRNPELTYPSRIQARKTWYANQISNLKNEIKEGKYDPVEPPTPVLLDAEALKLKDEYIAFKEQTRLRRAKKEHEALGTVQKNIRRVQQVLALRRLVQTSLDLSIPLRQGVSIMLNPRTANIGVKGYGKMLAQVFNEKEYQRMMFDIRSSDAFLESKDDGIVYTETSSSDPELRDESHPTESFLYKIPYIREPFRASERAAAAWTNYARYELYQRGVKMLKSQGKTRENAKKAYEDMAARVMVDTGRGKIPGIEDKSPSKTDTGIKWLLGNTFYGARLMSSTFRKLNPAYYFNPKVDSSVRRQAIIDMAGYVSSQLILVTAIAAATGASVSVDWDDPDFLKLRWGKRVIDLTAGQSTYIRTFMRLVNAAYNRANPYISRDDAEKYSKFATNSLSTFFRNKLAPNTSYGVNALMGTNSIGEKFDPLEIVKIAPMYSDDIVQAFKDGSPLDAAIILPIGISGLGYQEYSKDIRRARVSNYIDSNDMKLRSFLKKHQLNITGDINQEVYNLDAGMKVKMTKEQSDKYEKIWATNVIRSVKANMPELNALGEEDMKHEDEKGYKDKLSAKMSKIKSEATKMTQEAISGVNPDLLNITGEDGEKQSLSKELLKKRIDFYKEHLERHEGRPKITPSRREQLDEAQTEEQREMLRMKFLRSDAVSESAERIKREMRNR